jgi:serine/threonine protein kinase/Flp pilus assembly protein TadD
MSLPPGTHLSRYEIRSRLGAGGMGEVYLAWDTKLDRKIALKILPANLAANKDRLRRFEQEAKAASALNHPNIITIYEIEQIDSVNFIATELIEGETLRERTRSAPMKLGEVLDVAIQTASALSAAHASGIVHRDIKPENIMLRQDGIVKVLDFGLAKLTDRPRPESVSTQAPTRPVINTDPNVVMGTAIYMSPEQARGLQVDARTDIFSLGVVLYEMVTGRLPFEGSTLREVLASVLSDKEPQPLARYSRDAPLELERIVSKMLRKEREQRYQTTKDLLLDLQSLKQQLDFEARLERSIPPETREGRTAVSETSETVSGQPPSTASLSELRGLSTNTIKQHWRSLAIGAAVLVVAVSALTYRYYSTRSASAIDSIAVLPLINASNDPNTEYLSDGITESIISNLSQLPELKVMARSTVFHFKGKEIDPLEVGRKLGVRAVMSGRLLRQGDHLIVRTELVNVADGTQLWGGEYDRELSSVLSLQQDISREISEKLRLELTGEEKKRLTGRETTNGEAYQFYLRGRYLWNKRTADGITKAIEQFQQAIDRDPNYALGYVGLADSYGLLEEYSGVPSSETLPKARAAADRALRIDDSLSEAHTSSGSIFEQMWRWTETGEEYNRAISLNPNYPTAHHWLSIYFRTQGQLDDSLREIKRAQELDPLSSVIGQNVAEIYLLKNDLNSAIAQCQRIIELDPNFPGAHDELGFAYLKERRNEEATAEFQKTVDLSGRAARYLGDLGYCYAVSGRRAEAQTILKELEEKYDRREAIGQYVADVYAGLGDKDQAFAWLEKDYERRSGIRLPFIKWWFTFNDLRGDPRYADLLHRLGLKP